jgi:hypothetical protein
MGGLAFVQFFCRPRGSCSHSAAHSRTRSTCCSRSTSSADATQCRCSRGEVPFAT